MYYLPLMLKFNKYKESVFMCLFTKFSSKLTVINFHFIANYLLQKRCRVFIRGDRVFTRELKGYLRGAERRV